MSLQISIQYIIYTLSDPATGEVRYVGITRSTARKRFKDHAKRAVKGAAQHSSRWVATLLEKGVRPIVKEIESTSDSSREVFWIKHYRDLGCNLTNLTDGGISGFEHTLETKRKIAEAGFKRYKDLSGETIGRLKVIDIAGHKPLRWRCLCSCGNTAIIKAQSFSSKKVKSCGCLAKELAAQRTKARAKHGMCESTEYLAWREMRLKCNSRNHVHYWRNGALGIRVCAEWESFEAFFSDMGTRPPDAVLMRKDGSKNYGPDNCFWATKSQLRRSLNESHASVVEGRQSSG